MLVDETISRAYIICDPMDKVQIRNSFKNTTLISEIERKHIDDAMSDEYWVKAMQEELAMYQKNDVWKLVELPKEKFVDEVKWVFRNKFDETCKVGRNKVKVVAKG